MEETPKKCKDLIRATRELVKEKPEYQPRAAAIMIEFGAQNAMEREVMIMERILLQTFKFDLLVCNSVGRCGFLFFEKMGVHSKR